MVEFARTGAGVKSVQGQGDLCGCKEGYLHSCFLVYMMGYSRTSLRRTPKGQSKVSVLERCPLYRGREYYVTLKAPLMVLSVFFSQNWPQQVFETFSCKARDPMGGVVNVCGKAVNRGGG